MDEFIYSVYHTASKRWVQNENLQGRHFRQVWELYMPNMYK